MLSCAAADRLVTACLRGDLLSAVAAVADGSSVNGKGVLPGWSAVLPLTVAVASKQLDVVAWLLSHGADPNGDTVMTTGARHSTAAILQLLIDVGGDVNRGVSGRPLLFPAIDGGREDNVEVLLAQPCTDLTVTNHGKTLEQYVRNSGGPAVADLIADEVSGAFRTD